MCTSKWGETLGRCWQHLLASGVPAWQACRQCDLPKQMLCGWGDSRDGGRAFARCALVPWGALDAARESAAQESADDAFGGAQQVSGDGCPWLTGRLASAEAKGAAVCAGAAGAARASAVQWRGLQVLQVMQVS